jgi:hypothetical protein
MLFQSGAGHDLTAPDSPAAALLFAVIPEGQELWSSTQPESPGFPDGIAKGLTCGDGADSA